MEISIGNTTAGKSPVAATQLEPAHSEGRQSLWPWGARCWAVSQAAPDGSCWHSYMGVPGPDLPPVHPSSLPVPSFSSRLRRTLTQRNAERHLSRSPRPSPLSWPPFQCLGMFTSPRKPVGLDAEGDVCPCRHHPLRKWSRGSGGGPWGPAALQGTRPGQEAPSQLRGAAEMPVALAHLTQAPGEEWSLEEEEEAQVEVGNVKGGLVRGGAPRTGGRKGAGGDKGQDRGWGGGSQRGASMPIRRAGMRAASRQASTTPTSCSSASPRAAVAR